MTPVRRMLLASIIILYVMQVTSNFVGGGRSIADDILLGGAEVFAAYCLACLR